MKAILTLTIICLLASISYAHTGSIKGCVYDGSTHKPLEGVNVFIKGGNLSFVTDAFGTFFFKGLKDGGCTIIVSHIGYETAEEAYKIEDGVTSFVNISLLPAPVQMKDVAVSAGKGMNLNAISGLDLKSRPVNSTQDLMRLVPGLFIAQHQGGGKAEQIFLRGFDADHGTDVNITVDGMPVNMVSHAHGQGFADNHFIIPELVREMDFGKGPYEISKGDFATAGWVAFKTKNYLDNNFIKIDAGSFDYYRLAAGLNVLNKQVGDSREEAYIAGEYGYNRGYFDVPQNFNRFNLVGKYTNYLSNNRVFSITTSGFGTGWNASGQIPGRAINSGYVGRYGELDGEGGTANRYNINIQYAQAINNNTYLKSNVYAGYYKFSLYSDFTFFLKDSVNGDQVHQSEERYFAGSNHDLSFKYTALGFKMRTQVGTGFRYDHIMNDELSHTVSRSFLNNIALGDGDETNMYGYLSQSIYLLPQFVITAGTRFDEFVQVYDNKLSKDGDPVTSYNTHAFSPKLGAVYNFGNVVRLYCNYGVGFHSNDTRAVALAGSQQNAVQYVLPLAHSTDVGVLVKPTGNLLLSFAVWQMNLQQEFVYSGDESIVQPSGRTIRKGFDISVRYQPCKWLYIDGDINYSHARYRDVAEGDNYVQLAPPVTSIGGLMFKMNKNLSAGFRYRYMSDRPATQNYSITAPGYTIFDAVATYSKPKYEFGLQVQNLFNTAWNEAAFATETRLRYESRPVTDLCFTPGSPLFLKVSATYKF